MVVDLTWLRRDVLVGPPGTRVPRVGVPPAGDEIGAALGGLPFQPLGRALAHERLDSARHYPDQDEVEVTRVAVYLPAHGGTRVRPRRRTARCPRSRHRCVAPDAC